MNESKCQTFAIKIEYEAFHKIPIKTYYVGSMVNVYGKLTLKESSLIDSVFEFSKKIISFLFRK